MPGDPHPLETVYGDGNVDKAAVIADGKQGYRRVLADVDETRGTELDGQWLIYIRSLGANFRLDTEDLQADDGVNVVHDASGNHFLREAVSVSGTQEIVTEAGNVTLDSDSADTILINKTSGAATTVYLPPVASFLGRKIRIVDLKGDAATNNITVAAEDGSGHTVLGGSSYVIDSDHSSIELEAVSGVGWV